MFGTFVSMIWSFEHMHNKKTKFKEKELTAKPKVEMIFDINSGLPAALRVSIAFWCTWPRVLPGLNAPMKVRKGYAAILLLV